jgi:soluble lytic murein transglycosylase-like protein
MRWIRLPLVLMLLAAPSLRAELVVLENGRHLKVVSFEVEGAHVTLEMVGGARMHLPITAIERIVDDEVVRVDEEPGSAVEESLFPRRSWRFDRGRSPIASTRWNDWIMYASWEYDVDPALVSAVMKAESSFNPTVVSHKGAQGLMQLMPATARRFGVSDAFDPVQNIRGGVRYLRVLLDMFEEDAELALAAYNAGEGNVRKYGGVPPFRETRNYVRKISGYLAE